MLNHIYTFAGGDQILIRGETEGDIYRTLCAYTAPRGITEDYWQVVDHPASMRFIFDGGKLVGGSV